MQFLLSWRAAVFSVFLFHFCYTCAYPGCRASSSWIRFILRLLFSKANLCSNAFQQKKLSLIAVFQMAMLYLTSGFYLCTKCPRNMLLNMVFLSFCQTVEHGFPHQPSALGYSPFLRLMAIGTRSGAIKLYSFEQLWLDFSDRIRMCNFKDTVES